jgi:hypothetical protein
MDTKLFEGSEHELILRQHMREEYEKKLNMLEKEIQSMRTKYAIMIKHIYSIIIECIN